MPADITRNTFNRKKHFRSLVKQQGRLEIDADFNEAMDILLHRQEALATDLIGSNGTPPKADGSDGQGFVIQNITSSDFEIGTGHYYVDGILCENDGQINADGNLVNPTYKAQPDYPQPPALPAAPFLVYLDVWERHISAYEDDSIREKALGGPDTAARTKVVWQVKVTDQQANGDPLPNNSTCETIKDIWSNWLEAWQPKNRGLLKAMASDPASSVLDSPCITPPEARYRGAENQLYRVEIHKGGKAGKATFKWSRNNGSDVFPVTKLAGTDITLGYLGRDRAHSLDLGQWVELVDDDLILAGKATPLGKVKFIDPEQMTVHVDWGKDGGLPAYNDDEEYRSKHVLIRRWDHTDSASSPGTLNFDPQTGTLFITESSDPNSEYWLSLENGIQVSFTKAANDDQQYRTGDWWLIRVNRATGDVEWSWQRDATGQVVLKDNKPVGEALPPQGVEHHYASLAIATPSGTEIAWEDCRYQIKSIIGPGTNLHVGNLDVGGTLSVAGNTYLSGEVGIGTTNPNRPLTIRGQGLGEELIGFEDPTGTTKWHINQNLYGNNPGFHIAETGVADGRLFIKPGGNIGIGTTSPEATLHVFGSIMSTMWNVTQVFSDDSGPLPIKKGLHGPISPHPTGAFVSQGGRLLLFASGSGFRAISSGGGMIGMNIQIDDEVRGSLSSFTNEIESHKSFVSNPMIAVNVPAGNHSITIAPLDGTQTDDNDRFSLTVLELPFP